MLVNRNKWYFVFLGCQGRGFGLPSVRVGVKFIRKF